MNPNPLSFAFILIIVVLLTGCSGVVEETVQPTNTQPPPPPTETSVPPTPTPKDEPIFFGEVTFKDGECTLEGPEEVSTGKYYFNLIDESDTNLGLWINQLHDEKTFADLLDWQKEPGVYRSAPPWISHPSLSYSIELGKKLHIFDQVGNYAILLYSDNPSSLWFCAPFRVVEESSE
jgi:hypothetical protein